MQKYRNKPVVIEAILFDGTKESVAELLKEDGRPEKSYCYWLGSNLYCSTLEGDLKAYVGDWIIRGTRGEYHPCKPDVFQTKYEAVPSSHQENDE